MWIDGKGDWIDLNLIRKCLDFAQRPLTPNGATYVRRRCIRHLATQHPEITTHLFFGMLFWLVVLSNHKTKYILKYNIFSWLFTSIWELVLVNMWIILSILNTSNRLLEYFELGLENKQIAQRQVYFIAFQDPTDLASEPSTSSRKAGSNVKTGAFYDLEHRS